MSTEVWIQLAAIYTVEVLAEKTGGVNEYGEMVERWRERQCERVMARGRVCEGVRGFMWREHF